MNNNKVIYEKTTTTKRIVMLPVYLEADTSEFRRLRPPVSPFTLMISKLRIKEVPALLNLINMLTLKRILAFSRVGAGEETLRNHPVSQFVCWLDSLRHLPSFLQL